MTVRHAQRPLVKVYKGARYAFFRKFIRKSSHAGSVEKTIRCGCLPMVKHLSIVCRINRAV